MDFTKLTETIFKKHNKKVVMPLAYQPNGNLIKGVHLVTWDEFVHEFGYNERRKDLLEGLEKAITDLAECGCCIIYVDGSFVTKKRNPGDFDVCWKDNDGNIDLFKLRSEYVALCNGSKERQLLHYKGELKGAYAFADWEDYYIDYFQKDKIDKSPKGIIQLNIKAILYDKE